MSGPTGPTGATGIAGIYGRQGAIGPDGGRGNQGPAGGYGNPTMQCQTFFRGGETSISSENGIIIRPVFGSASPALSGVSSRTIPGMQVMTQNDLIVPPGTYLIQASSIGVNASGQFTNTLAIRDATTTGSNILLGIATKNDGMTFLDGVATFTSNTTVRLAQYSSSGFVTVINTGGGGNSCMISFIKIQ
jgi:hypothetical protein